MFCYQVNFFLIIFSVFPCRTLFSVVRCGSLKLEFPDENEELLVLRAMYDTNLPKMVSKDIAPFKGVISDCFPGLEHPKADYEVFLDTARKVCADFGIQPVPAFLEKLIQTYETSKIRHGFMLVGESFSGTAHLFNRYNFFYF